MAGRIISTVLFLLLLVLFSLVLIQRIVPGISLPDLSFFSSRKEAAYTVAEEIDDLYLFNTTEYRLKLIFPQDFVDRDLNWRYVREMYIRGAEVSQDLEDLVEIYKASLASGFDLAEDSYDFLVLTAVVKAGIPLGSTPFDRNTVDRLYKISENDRGKVIQLDLPDTAITEMYIDDRKPSEDNFPDREMTPGQWKDLVGFLNPLIEDRVKTLGILEDAEANARHLLEKILLDSGFVEVQFGE